MKELSIEEKVKAYDEALKKAKDMLSYKEVRREDMEYLFPELKESEDERIKKELIDFFQDWHKVKPSRLNVNVSDILAWLEKQGEHHIVCSEEQMKVLDEVLNFAANHESPYWNNYIFETLNNLIRQLKN